MEYVNFSETDMSTLTALLVTVVTLLAIVILLSVPPCGSA